MPLTSSRDGYRGALASRWAAAAGVALLAAALVAAVLATPAHGSGMTRALSARRSAPQPRISGNQLVDASGAPLQLRGVNLPGGATCVEPNYDPYRRAGLLDMPMSNTELARIAAWHVNVVRIALDEDCWLGKNPVRRYDQRIAFVPAAQAQRVGREQAAHYRAGIEDLVNRAKGYGMAAIIDLHFTAPGRSLAFAQWPLPDASYSVAFWKSAAAAFRNDPSVMFEIYNEPYGGDPERMSWTCLRDGCTWTNACADCYPGVVPHGDVKPGCGNRCPTRKHPDGTYQTAGMQSLVDAIRSMGATQPILAPGRHYTNDLRQWLKYMPNDPLHQLGASFHPYENTRCGIPSCWNSEIAPVAARVPVVATEFGPSTVGDTSGFDVKWMTWADAHRVSYVADGWYPQRNDWESLLLSWKGTPRPGHGTEIHDHYVAA